MCANAYMLQYNRIAHVILPLNSEGTPWVTISEQEKRKMGTEDDNCYPRLSPFFYSDANKLT
jgi:hypothetical protein